MALPLAYVEVFLTFVAILVATLYFRNKKDRRYPPGPRALPIIGNVLQLGASPQKKLGEWAEKYGPIFSIKMGSDDVIVLNEHKIIKDVFQDASSSGRTQNPIFMAIAKGNYGLVMVEGIHWEAQRRFTLRKLRDFGFAKTAMEGSIMEEVNSFIKWTEKRSNCPVSGNRIFNGAVVNALWNIISGERNDWDSSNPPKILSVAERTMNAFNRTNTSGLLFAPFLRFIAPEYFGWNNWLKCLSDLNDTTSISVKNHLAELDPNNPHDFIDHYLVEKQNTTDPKSSFYKENGDKNLLAGVIDLFMAGSETTSHTLSWTLLLLAHNQNIQAKMQKELDSVVGKDRQPNLADRPNLPYIEAVIMEVLRKTTIVNTGIPHRMLEDATFHGYFFPKNTTIISNLYYVHNNPDVWGNPENFRPERFLSDDGLKIVKHEAFIPYSVGKRQCLGMSLANDTLFLFTSAIFQKFCVKQDPTDDSNVIDTKPTAKLFNEPDPFKIIMELR